MSFGTFGPWPRRGAPPEAERDVGIHRIIFRILFCLSVPNRQVWSREVVACAVA